MNTSLPTAINLPPPSYPAPPPPPWLGLFNTPLIHIQEPISSDSSPSNPSDTPDSIDDYPPIPSDSSNTNFSSQKPSLNILPSIIKTFLYSNQVNHKPEYQKWVEWVKGNGYENGRVVYSDHLPVLLASTSSDGIDVLSIPTGRGGLRIPRMVKSFSHSDITHITKIFSCFNVTGIPQVQASGFVHFEGIQLMVDHIAKDRVSDIACNFISSWLIDYTIQQCDLLKIPCEQCQLDVYAYDMHKFVKETVNLPVLPTTKSPLLFVPKRWLRLDPWLGYDDYYQRHFPKTSGAVIAAGSRIDILTYNRQNYGLVEAYVKEKERTHADCRNDPLFSPIPVLSVKRKLSMVQKIPSGTKDAADKKYEDAICQLMASLLYPQLDFADEQSRVDSGVLIRDMIFYNNRSYKFLKDIYDEYDCRQIVVELKNVKEIEREHINQVNRYLKDQFGRFAIIMTRNPPPKPMFRNTIDLWSAQRRCILILDDSDLAMMCGLFASRQRLPVDVIMKKYVEFTRACPG